ncbi:MAG TPA: DUF692 domain-containing protein [Polyangiaceae bacterium]|nr:DUF692 domain-containing protein [Polyangiaceae bacterium]
MQEPSELDADSPSGIPTGVGLGLRWEFLEEVVAGPPLDVAFFEVSPENYMRRGGYYPAQLERLRERYRFVTHGLTLSIGAIDPPDRAYLAELRAEIARLGTPFHSDHLCFSSSGGRMLHDLLPLKLSEENVMRVADRARRVEDALGVPFALENISYYAVLGRSEMPEAEFLARVIEKSQVGLLLDVNNVYVNSVNHGYDPYAFLRMLPLDRVVEIHIAGHERQENGLIIDTHGAEVVSPVYDLLAHALERTGPVPVLLERDNDVPPLSELLEELARVRSVYSRVMRSLEPNHAKSA